jgi:hypothetical protein
MKRAKRTLLVLGGSADQLFLVRTAQAMDLAVLCLDQNEDSPCFAEAEECALVSTRDVPAILAFLERRRAVGWGLDGVLTMGSDIPDVVAAVAEHFRAPRSVARVRAPRDRQVRDEAALPGARHPDPVVRGGALARRAARAHWPSAAGSCSSPWTLGLAAACSCWTGRSDPAELYRLAARVSRSAGACRSRNTSTARRSRPRRSCGTARACVPGFADRNYELSARFHPQIMENGAVAPSQRFTGDDRRALEELTVSGRRAALGIERGVAKGDLVWTRAGPKVIEIAARLSGGDFCESLVPLLRAGVNYARAAIRIALGEEPDWARSAAPVGPRLVANRYFFPEPGASSRSRRERGARAAVGEEARVRRTASATSCRRARATRRARACSSSSPTTARRSSDASRGCMRRCGSSPSRRAPRCPRSDARSPPRVRSAAAANVGFDRSAAPRSTTAPDPHPRVGARESRPPLDLNSVSGGRQGLFRGVPYRCASADRAPEPPVRPRTAESVAANGDEHLDQNEAPTLGGAGNRPLLPRGDCPDRARLRSHGGRQGVAGRGDRERGQRHDAARALLVERLVPELSALRRPERRRRHRLGPAAPLLHGRQLERRGRLRLPRHGLERDRDHLVEPPSLPGQPATSLGTVATDTWIAVDLTAVIGGPGTYVVALAGGSSNSAYYSAREGTQPPGSSSGSRAAEAAPDRMWTSSGVR